MDKSKVARFYAHGVLWIVNVKHKATNAAESTAATDRWAQQCQC